MNLNNLRKVGFALSNSGLTNDIEKQVRAEYPQWTDGEVKAERNIRLKANTLFNDNNKQTRSKRPQATKVASKKGKK
jgi:hypothetical protein